MNSFAHSIVCTFLLLAVCFAAEPPKDTRPATPATILSARLHERTHEASSLEWAEKTLAWVREKKLYDGTAIVDAPGHRGDYWTYNQGVYLGALATMASAAGKKEFLDEAARAVETIIDNSGDVLPNGVIVEKLGGRGWDPGLFKGIFARYLGQLRELREALVKEKVQPDVVTKIDRELRASAASMLASSTGQDGQFGFAWIEDAKETRRNFNTHVSGLALLAAALATQR